MKAFDVLKRIEDNGFEAYIVGGYVRNYVLGLDSNDIDICTNARVKDLLLIFHDLPISSNEYGAVKIITNDYKFDITTYRRDVRYNGNRKTVEMEYVDNLLDDIKRRDFTINTLCMSKEGNIVDILNGKKDIEDKIIRCVGDAEERIKEDPLRMLRAVRFATTLNFKIEENLYKALKHNASLIEELSLDRVKEELTKILVSSNALFGLDLCTKLGFIKYMGISYDKSLVYVSDICGMYSQLTFNKEYPFSKKEKESINNIREIVAKGIIDKETVFDYGLYTCIVAGSILGIDTNEVIKLEKSLVIKKRSDINISSDEICKVLIIKPSKVISDVYEYLKRAILNEEVNNDNGELKAFVYSNREMWLNERTSKENITS